MLFILSPASRLLCAYPYDGGAMNFDDGCGPFMCDPDHVWGCAFPLGMLERMLTVHENGPQWPYNEVVVDAGAMVVEAVFGAGSTAVHARLLSHFGLDARQLPLLDFNPAGAVPFTCRMCVGGYP